jgi:hypothetical protein
MLVACNKTDTNSIPAMNLCDYCSLTYEYTNGDGWASIEGARAIKEDFMQKLGGNVTEMQMQTMVSGVDFQLSKRDKLSNGDEIVLTITVDEDIKEVFGVKLVGGQKTFIVEGLPEKIYTDFDPFEPFDIAFEGVSPFVHLKGFEEGYYSQYIGGKYEIENFDQETQYLKNGDKIKVKFTYDEERAENHCIKVIATEKEFVIDGHDRCLITLDDVSNSQWDKLVSDAINKSPGCEYIGHMIFVANKQPAHGVHFIQWCGMPAYNAVCFVFKYNKQVWSEEVKDVVKQPEYAICGLQNILIDENNTLKYSHHDIPSVNLTYLTYDSIDQIIDEFIKVNESIMVCSNSDIKEVNDRLNTQ